jgi:hypothetical protein
MFLNIFSRTHDASFLVNWGRKRKIRKHMKLAGSKYLASTHVKYT